MPAKTSGVEIAVAQQMRITLFLLVFMNFLNNLRQMKNKGRPSIIKTINSIIKNPEPSPQNVGEFILKVISG